jgi:acyl-CoA synthetase (AMP-forming)/AMP-acid ligase II
MKLEDYPLPETDAAPFLHYVPAGSNTVSRVYPRSELRDERDRAVASLDAAGLSPGDRFLLCMDANRVEDLVWRLAAAETQTIPVTVNWQADTLERIRFKKVRTGVKAVAVSSGFSLREHPEFTEAFEGCGRLVLGKHSDTSRVRARPADSAPRIVIFTSGTTGDPKPVSLSYGAYRANQSVFESFMNVEPGELLTLVVTNPLHHANSTAITDWAMRRRGTKLFLFERFSRAFWSALVSIVEGTKGRVIVPAVSRHFDLLESLEEQGDLGVEKERLRAALAKVTFLVGSAPVGPNTVGLFEKWTNSLPTVRFGSTELCLQAIGISPEWPAERVKRAFRRGWSHRVDTQPLTGFLIGRAHPPWTEARVVASVDPAQSNFMEEVPAGVLGRLVVRSECAFQGYWDDSLGTEAVWKDGWYLGLGDHAFTLASTEDGEPDFYWVGRDAGLMIRGGANYSCQQVAAELLTFVCVEFGLDEADLDLVVVGLKLESDHEDTCCVMIQCASATPQLRDRLEADFIRLAYNGVSKGARPDRLLLSVIPRNFKGALDVRKLQSAFLEPETPES